LNKHPLISEKTSSYQLYTSIYQTFQGTILQPIFANTKHITALVLGSMLCTGAEPGQKWPPYATILTYEA